MTGIASSLAGSANKKPVKITPLIPNSRPTPSSAPEIHSNKLFPFTCHAPSAHKSSPVGAATITAWESTCSVFPKTASFRIFFSCGRRYADISNTNGIPVSLFNLLLSREDTRNVPPAPIQTAAVNTSASRRLFSRPSRTAPIARSIGNRPLHGIIAFVQTAVSFSARVGMILHPVTPTALHPRPIHIVSAWRPEVPQRAKMWSVRKAARGRYPASSRTENRKKKIAAGGSITAVTRAAVA